ncbi:MAG: glycosyltransferase family 4 protein [Bacteroidales bacterium]|nr:glycosyltransferase family 4 protein [Bacteroidales bacterium]MCF8389129.1 glycosyltransferase family 4 protein [Bacteroidales bacterium]
MKIAFDAKRAFRNFSGLGNYSRTLINSLSKYFPENEYYLYTPEQGTEIVGFPPNPTSIVMPEKFLDKKFSSYWRTYMISESVRQKKIELYHGLSHELPKNIEKSGAASVVTIHDLIFYRYPELYKAFDRKIYKKKYAHSVKVADKIIAISEQTKRDIVEFLGVDESKIEVVYQSSNPIFNTKYTQSQLSQIKEKYDLPSEFVLSVGTIEKRKNLLELVKAVHHSKSGIPIIVIGKEKEYAKEVFSYIAKNQMSDTYFLKNVPTEDLPAIYQLASLFVYPSSFEGFGLPVLEALQSGTPVIAAKGSCLEETGGKESIYINPFNTGEFSEAINMVLGNSELRKKMKSHGYEFSKAFLPETTIKSLYTIYESIC